MPSSVPLCSGEGRDVRGWRVPQAPQGQGVAGLSRRLGPWHLAPPLLACSTPLSPSPRRLPGGQCSKTLMVPSCTPTGDKMSTGPIVRKPTMHRYISTKVLLAEGRETPFAEHCRNYENTYRVGSAGRDGSGTGRDGTGGCCSRGGASWPLQMLQTEIQGLKDQVQELHRDLTKHHSLIKTEIMSEILQKSLQMDVQIAAHYSAVEMMRSVFEEVWSARPGRAGALRAVPQHAAWLPLPPSRSGRRRTSGWQTSKRSTKVPATPLPRPQTPYACTGGTAVATARSSRPSSPAP